MSSLIIPQSESLVLHKGQAFQGHRPFSGQALIQEFQGYKVFSGQALVQEFRVIRFSVVNR